MRDNIRANYDAEIDGLNAEIARLRANSENMKHDIARLLSSVSTAEAEVERSNAENTRLNIEIAAVYRLMSEHAAAPPPDDLANEIERLNAENEGLQADVANGAGLIDSLKKGIDEMCAVIGIERGHDHWPEFIERVRAAVTRLRVAPSARLVEAARKITKQWQKPGYRYDNELFNLEMELGKALAEHDAAPPNDGNPPSTNLVAAARAVQNARFNSPETLLENALFWLGRAIDEHDWGPPDNGCAWLYDTGDDGWKTSCGELVILYDDTPQENDMRYCCYCGRSMRYPPPASDKDAE